MRAEPDWKADRLTEASGVAQQELPPGALYVVATPIGNLADVTVRALWVLSHVDAIAAEDTRTTRTLLDRYRIGIGAGALIAVHEHNEAAAAERIAGWLREGRRVALVSDAGTPAISDPGARLVRHVMAAGLRVVPIPGPSSLATALSAAGIDRGAITFIGFLPHGARERGERLRALGAAPDAAVLFEAPHRLRETAEDLASVLDPRRRVVVARELTKRFETIETIAAGDLPAYAGRQAPRGEYVLVVDAAAAAPPAAEVDATTRRWLAALAPALPPARAAAVAAAATGLPRDVLYRELTARGYVRGESATD